MSEFSDLFIGSLNWQQIGTILSQPLPSVKLP